MKYKHLKCFTAAIFFLIAGFLFSGESESGLLLYNVESPSSEEGLQTETALEHSEREVESETEERIRVHVCGAVKKAGVYTLLKGAIAADAVMAAGGASADAALDCLNLAQAVADGEQIYVPSVKETGETHSLYISGKGEGDASGKVNINTADESQLMTLSGIGQSRAQAILAYRNEHGSFQSIEEIMNVPGIKEGAFTKIRDSIRV